MPDLLLCPHCGSSAAFHQLAEPDSDNDGGYYIECANPLCGMTTTLMFACGDDPKPLLAERWNRRVTPASDGGVSRVAAMPAPSDVPGGAEWLSWAQEMFGDIALDPQERALRFVEEALELGQAMGIEAVAIAKTAHRVYSRPAGDPAKEIAQSSATLDTLAYVMKIDPRAAATAEFDRVRSIPKEEWARRHQAKVDAGFALKEPAPSAPAKPTPDLLRWRGAFKGMPNLDEDPSEPVGSLSAELAELRAIPGWDGPTDVFEPSGDTPTRDELIEALEKAHSVLDRTSIGENTMKLRDDAFLAGADISSVLARTRRG